MPAQAHLWLARASDKDAFQGSGRPFRLTDLGVQQRSVVLCIHVISVPGNDLRGRLKAYWYNQTLVSIRRSGELSVVSHHAGCTV